MSEFTTPEYYRHRERQERALAAAAMSPGVRKVHLEFADYYAALIEETQLKPFRTTSGTC